MGIRWNFIAEIFPDLVKGAVYTLEVTVAGIALGIVIGLIISLFRISGVWPLRTFGKAYTDFFRGTPLLVQIMIIHFALPVAFGYRPNMWSSAIAALSINSGAYVSEIFRAGIQAVDRGQMEAARSLGMTWGQAMTNIILPQAFKISIPPLGNEFIALLKDSSLLFVIGFEELMTTGRLIQGRTPRPPEIWLSVAILYLVLTTTIATFVNWTESKFRTDKEVNL